MPGRIKMKIILLTDFKAEGLAAGGGRDDDTVGPEKPMGFDKGFGRIGKVFENVPEGDKVEF